MTLAFVFPGQGSQKPGMGKDLAHAFPDSAGRVFQAADRALGFSISDLCFSGSEAELAQTEITQPALFTTSAAALAVLSEVGIKPMATAGHSVGEYCALLAAGAVKFEDALPVVRKRGELMAAANKATPGSMAAIIGLNSDGVYEICGTASTFGIVEPSNLNSPTQIVISGETDAVLAAVGLAKARGGKAIQLKVGAPFHCSLMGLVREDFQSTLMAMPCRDADMPVIANATGQPVTTAHEIRQALLDQVERPVRWTATVAWFTAHGISDFLEVGPGRVLSGLIKSSNPNAMVTGVSVPTDFDALKPRTGAFG